MLQKASDILFICFTISHIITFIHFTSLKKCLQKQSKSFKMPRILKNSSHSQKKASHSQKKSLVAIATLPQWPWLRNFNIKAFIESNLIDLCAPVTFIIILHGQSWLLFFAIYISFNNILHINYSQL
jgi:hypothetical protein